MFLRPSTEFPLQLARFSQESLRLVKDREARGGGEDRSRIFFSPRVEFKSFVTRETAEKIERVREVEVRGAKTLLAGTWTVPRALTYGYSYVRVRASN